MRMYILFLLAPVLVCGTESGLLQTVFGTPPSNAAQEQVIPVTPATNFNISAADDEDYDFDEFIPTEGDFDKFDLTLTKYMASQSSDSFVISPMGLKLAMAILSEAASGMTRAELDLVLDFTMNRTVVRQKFARIVDSLKSKSANPPYKLDLGSRIYVSQHVNIPQRFSSIAQVFYKTEIKNIDFTRTGIAAKAINDWVAGNTQGKISDLVNEGDIVGAALVVVDTLFFKGTWRYQFDPKSTKNDVFYTSATVTQQATYMKLHKDFFYADSERLDAKILRMPYLGNKLAMYLVVPNTLLGVTEVFNNVVGLRSEMLKLRRHLVDVTLPKFEMQFTSHLDDILRDMGVRQAFEDTATFTGLTHANYLPQRLKVSKVFQKSGIEVNEVGTLAYSATEVSIVNKFGEDKLKRAEVNANRPFMFFIQDEHTQQILFMGRYSDPNISEGTLKPVKA